MAFRRLVGDDGNLFIISRGTRVTQAPSGTDPLATLVNAMKPNGAADIGADDNGWYRVEARAETGSKLSGAIGGIGGIHYLPGDLVLAAGDSVSPLAENIVGAITSVSFEVSPTEIDVTTIGDTASATRLGRNTWSGSFEGILEAELNPNHPGDSDVASVGESTQFKIQDLIRRVTSVHTVEEPGAAAAATISSLSQDASSLSAMLKLQDPDRASGQQEILLWLANIDLGGLSFGLSIGTAQAISGSLVIADGSAPPYIIRNIT